MTALTPAIRKYIYGIVTAALPLLVVYGVLDSNDVALWLALAAGILGTGTAFANTSTSE